MDGELIKSFLVGLGFGVDDASLAKFNKSIASATLRVTGLYASVEATTAAVAFGISKISESFEDLGYEYKLIAPAINKALILRQEMLKAYQATGVDLVKTVQNALKLNISITKTKYAFEALYKSVASRFFTLLTKQSDLFRQRLYENMPRIQEALENFVKFVFQAFDIAATLGARFWSVLQSGYDIFQQLDRATGGWSTRILGAIAAWKLLNLGFIATPLGAVITGLVGIIALFDDFKVWQKGGKSFFDWTSFVPVIDAVGDALQRVLDILKDIKGGLIEVKNGFRELKDLNFSAIGERLQKDAPKAVDALKNPVGLIGDIGHAEAALVIWLQNLLLRAVGANPLPAYGPNSIPNIGVPAVSPVSSSVRNTQSSNATLHQQTNISVQGVADAQKAAGLVGDQQTKTNADLMRYLGGATTPGNSLLGRTPQ